MSSSVLTAGLLAVALLGIASLIAVAETALTRISRARADGFAVDNRSGAEALAAILTDRSKTLGPLLLLRAGAQVGLVIIVITMVADRYAVGTVVWVSFLLVGGVYVFAEAIPRIWALQHLDRAALASARVLAVLLRLAPLRLLTRLLNAVANLLLPGPAGAPVVSEDELMAMAEAAVAGASIDAEEQDLIRSVFALGDTLVREIMVPRTDMTTAEATATVTEVLDVSDAQGFSRIPVSNEGIDDIVGVCLVKDLVRAERNGQGSTPVRQLMREPRFVPETKHADDLLREMQQAGQHLAIVIDEYGGTAGLVTLEDLVEELVGEIVDETDQEAPLIESVGGGNLLVHGRMPVDQLEGLLGLSFAEGEWDTVGGLIFTHLGRVPDVGQVIDVDAVRLEVIRMEGRRITLVRVDRNPEDGS